MLADPIESKLQERISSFLNDEFGTQTTPEEIKIQPTNKEFEGTHTFVVFPYLRFSKKSPEETANIIGNLLKNEDTISSFEVKKGFLNLSIPHKLWIETLTGLLKSDFQFENELTGKEIIVEYSSPNTNKPLHLGHLRNIFLGYSVSNILESSATQVIKTQIVNDRCIDICKSMVAWKKICEGETPES
jgi:arginyl-tRNA synthetase